MDASVVSWIKRADTAHQYYFSSIGKKPFHNADFNLHPIHLLSDLEALLGSERNISHSEVRAIKQRFSKVGQIVMDAIVQYQLWAIPSQEYMQKVESIAYLLYGLPLTKVL